MSVDDLLGSCSYSMGYCNTKDAQHRDSHRAAQQVELEVAVEAIDEIAGQDPVLADPRQGSV